MEEGALNCCSARPQRAELVELEIAGHHTGDERVPLGLGERENWAFGIFGISDHIRRVDLGNLDARTASAASALQPCELRIPCVHSDLALLLISKFDQLTAIKGAPVTAHPETGPQPGDLSPTEANADFALSSSRRIEVASSCAATHSVSKTFKWRLMLTSSSTISSRRSLS